MPWQLVTARRRAVTAGVGIGLGILLTCTQPSAPARAETTATIAPSFAPDRLGAKGALTLTIDYAGELGLPAPVRRSLVKLPAGLGLDIPVLRSCSAARLRARGASGCPAHSQIGSGEALLEGDAGSQLIDESVKLWIFLGPLHGFQPTFEVLAQGYTPLEERIVLDGTVIPASAPYGEALAMEVPPIPTLPLEPDASLATLTLTVGARANRLARGANAVVVPGSCPVGGFPFATESTYADGSASSDLATATCPQ
jgi:hypothetical protein